MDKKWKYDERNGRHHALCLRRRGRVNSICGFYQPEREAWLCSSCQTVIKGALVYLNGKVMFGVITKLDFDIFGYLSLVYIARLACT